MKKTLSLIAGLALTASALSQTATLVEEDGYLPFFINTRVYFFAEVPAEKYFAVIDCKNSTGKYITLEKIDSATGNRYKVFSTQEESANAIGQLKFNNIDNKFKSIGANLCIGIKLS